MNDNKLRCKDCMFCSSQNSEQQAGLCTEEHSPKNASGIPMKTVPLWAYACRYGKQRIPLPAKRVQRRTRR